MRPVPSRRRPSGGGGGVDGGTALAPLLVVIVVSALGLAACSHSSNRSPSSSQAAPSEGAPSEGTPSTTAVPGGGATTPGGPTTTTPGGANGANGGGAAGGGANLPQCQGATLSGTLLGANTYPAGFTDWLIELRNTSPGSCTMTGYPTTQLLGDTGQQLPTKEHRGAGPAVGGRLPDEVDLLGGGAAVFGVETYDCAGTATQPPSPKILVTAPGDTTPITVTLDRPITTCGGGDVLVSPVRQNPAAGIPT